MNYVFLSLGFTFLLIGLFFSVGGGLMVGSTFLSLALVFVALGFVLGREGDAGRDVDEPDQPTG